MNEAFKDGGPAYPMADPFVVSTPKNEAEAQRLAQGMSLRDHFAGLAMQQHMQALSAATTEPGTTWSEVVSMLAYQMADAMLRARAKGGES